MKLPEKYLDQKEFKDSLYLSVTEIPEGFNPTVGGSLDLDSVTEIPEGFNPTVGGSLDLDSVTEIPEGFNPTVGGSLHLLSVTEIPEGFNPTVGGSLFLDSVTEIPEGFNPTVGGSLHLRSVTEIPEGFNPTVGGSLDLDSVTEIPEGFNPTVGGSLFLESVTRYIGADVKPTNIYQWCNGKYALIDGIFGEVIKHIGNSWKMKKINGDVFYVVSDGNENYAHGETAEDAKADLIFKICDRKKEDYTDHTLYTVMPYQDAIVCYRVITGACSFGVKDFVKTVLNGEPDKEYSVEKIIELTTGHYGAESFKSFFKKGDK